MFTESVLSELRVCVRSDVDIKFVKQLPQLGWRFRKQSFIVTLKNVPKKEYILHWIPFGPDKYLDDEDLWSVIKAFTSLQVFEPSTIKLFYKNVHIVIYFNSSLFILRF